MKHKQTKATDIPSAVIEQVEKRDSIDGWPCCIICGSPNARGWCHYISRKHGGLGIEENLWTGCQKCHDKYDKTEKHDEIGAKIEAHLRSHYSDWDRSKLVYNKWRDLDPAYRFDNWVK
jgi:5-methylcytosine-specific restriction endonuclease McrA